MIVGKLYRSIDEITDLPKEIKEQLSIDEELRRCTAADDNHCFIAKVDDLSCRNYAYGMAVLSDNQYEIRKLVYSHQSEYLVDGCIRMIVNEIFNYNYEFIIADVETSANDLEQIYRLIGFITVERSKNHLNMKIDKQSLKSCRC